MRWLALALLVVRAVPCPGQDTGRAHGSLFIELGGNAFLGTTGNVEVWLARSLGVRAGAGLDVYSSTPVYPFQVVMLAGAGRSRLELAAGVTIAHEDPAYSGNWHWDGTKPFASGFLGYRYRRPRGFMFRIGVVPLLWTNAHIAWVAIGLGTTF